jgi:deoxyribodipyrimidine photolyase-related protein
MNGMLVILGNQLFPMRHLPPPGTTPVFMAEDLGLCTYEKHHQQKIVLFLAAMRSYADELRDAGYDVHYVHLDSADASPYEAKLRDALTAANAEQILHFEIEDKAMERRLIEFAANEGLRRSELASPMFLSSRAEFAEFAAGKSRLLMGDFYKQQRRRLGILVDDDGKPTGGHWSFDADNRKKLPRSITPPEVPAPTRTRHVEDLIELVERDFPEHPGKASCFRWPTTRAQARACLRVRRRSFTAC